jgi:uncharacterized membrane protein
VKLKFKTAYVLAVSIFAMATLIGYSLLFPERITAFIEKPDFYLHAKFVHIVAVTLFFANTVIGTIWETRSLLSKDPAAIRYTYETVLFLDAVFTAPLILVSVCSGIMLGTILGGVWSIGWLSIAFSLFLLSGVLWCVADIPSQYKMKKLFKVLDPKSTELPKPVSRLLWFRMGINLVSIVPLLFIFFLMVFKPDVPTVASILGLKPSVALTQPAGNVNE